MNIAIRSAFWVVTFGGIGYALFKIVKPADELLKKFHKDSQHTDTNKFAKDSISILKNATEQNGELNKKIEDLLKKGK